VLADVFDNEADANAVALRLSQNASFNTRIFVIDVLPINLRSFPAEYRDFAAAALATAEVTSTTLKEIKTDLAASLITEAGAKVRITQLQRQIEAGLAEFNQATAGTANQNILRIRTEVANSINYVNELLCQDRTRHNLISDIRYTEILLLIKLRNFAKSL
jgi:hypothetical protein